MLFEQRIPLLRNYQLVSMDLKSISFFGLKILRWDLEIANFEEQSLSE